MESEHRQTIQQLQQTLQQLQFQLSFLGNQISEGRQESRNQPNIQSDVNQVEQLQVSINQPSWTDLTGQPAIGENLGSEPLTGNIDETDQLTVGEEVGSEPFSGNIDETDQLTVGEEVGSEPFSDDCEGEAEK